MLSDPDSKRLEYRLINAGSLSLIGALTISLARRLSSMPALLVVTSLGACLVFWGLRLLLPTLPEARLRTAFKVHYEVCLLSAAIYLAARDQGAAWAVVTFAGAVSLMGCTVYCLVLRKQLRLDHLLPLFAVILAMPLSELDDLLRHL